MGKNLKTNIADPSAKPPYIESKGGCMSPALQNKYAVRVTESVKDTIQGDVSDDPVAKQYIPQAKELKILPTENIDPIGDHVHTPVKGLVHRHDDRVLFKLANVCAVYCRYCFRREMVGPGGDVLSEEEIRAALDYIRNHPEMREVILTGGDPLVLSGRKLERIFSALENIPHIDVIRIHSRVPIADPKRISDDVLQSLNRQIPVYMVVHINHAQELSPAVIACLDDLHKAGCILLSQSVLLKGVNDDVETLETLFRALVKHRVKPYYIHHPDLAPGTSHFRITLEKGRDIMAQLHSRMTGIALPNYMLDIPGGFGKVPVNDSYIKTLGEGRYLVEDPQGVRHHYPPEQES